MILALGLSWAVMGGGCRSVVKKADNKKLKPQAIKKSEEDKMNMVAERYGDDILQAIKNEDYKLFIKHFLPEAQKRISEKSFKQRIVRLKSKVGNIKSKKFLTTLHQELFRTYVWKVEFIRHGAKGPVKIQEIFRLMLIKMDGQYYVLNFYLY